MDMKNTIFIFAAAVLLVAWYNKPGHRAVTTNSRPAPEFPCNDTSRWINAAPLKMASDGENGLRGKVVLLNVWTFM
jgi:hypothetical protein